MNEDFLCHYGVLGMKWGVRKSRPKSSVTSSRNKFKKSKKTSIKSVKANKKKKVKVKDLSDADLQKRINRLQMEKRYRDLKKDELSEGRKLVGDIMKTVGKTVGVQVGTYAAAKVINKLMDDEVVSTKSKKKKQQSESKSKAA